MDAKQDAVNQEINVIDTIEIAGEFIMEQRHRHERRQRQSNHCSRYERRLNNRRNARRNKIDITI
ncbi:MAG: hypothetical protein COA76_13145 [Moritella sp.]|uniref:hypothetical protein n=1 Tax=unclassified Moritella TaxID=2637987 RepID=UPI0001568508|nr:MULTISPECIES: hypothetical protein [unclassified Moritella]EDM68317.1 hypothetical protein PE36_16009 [Moritella sp. PE36]MBL1415315.1 hypothetical protein [Moritella sp.]PHR86986.1 MAG: hypothetical protein COA76_13145 [Moritella sp.]